MISKLTGLAADMEALRRGVPPARLAGDAAPLLEDWRFRLGNNLHIDGLSSGHPKLIGEGRPISTSEVFLMADDERFVRTFSRWYRLGNPSVPKTQGD